MAELKRSLKAFMRDPAMTEEIIRVPGPATILGEDGKPVTLEIKVLSQARIQEINDNYKTRTVAFDKKGNPYTTGNDIVFRTDHDHAKASRHMMIEALVFPNLKDPELMDYYKCNDATDMPLKVFRTADEYAHVSRAVMAALGLSSEPSLEVQDKALSEAKN